MTKHTYTILQLIYTSTCVNWQTQLRTAWFCCSSFTANILVLVAIHAFTLRRWCQNSLPWCYLHDLRTIHRLCTITPSPYHIGHGNVTAVKIVLATNLMTNSTDLCSHRRPLLASDTQQCLLGHWGSAQVRVQSDNELIQCRQQGPLKVLDSFHQLATNIYTHNWLIFIIQHLQLTSLQSTWKLFTNSIQIYAENSPFWLGPWTVLPDRRTEMWIFFSSSSSSGCIACIQCIRCGLLLQTK